MKIHTISLILLLGLIPQRSKEQSIPFSFYQIPSYSNDGNAFFAAASNPSFIGSVRKFSVGMYSEMRYALKDLVHQSGFIGFPVSFGTIGAHVFHIGNIDFSETAFLLQYAKKLSEQKSYVGISFGLMQKKDKGYTNLRQYLASIGLKLPLSDNIGYNVVMSVKQMGGKEADRSVVLDYQLGVGYHITPQFVGSVQINKEAKRDVQSYVKGCYQIHPGTSVSIACATATQEMWVQAIFLLKSMQVGFSIGFHQIIGATPGCMIMTKE